MCKKLSGSKFQGGPPVTKRAQLIHRKGPKRAALFLVALVVLASSVVTLISPQPASALTKVGSSTGIDDQIRSLLYYRALGICIEKARWTHTNLAGGLTHISKDDAHKGQWFDSSIAVGTVVEIGAYMRGIVADNDDSHVVATCSTPKDIVVPAMALWGISNPEDFLCDIGAVRVDSGKTGAGCYAGTGFNGELDTSGITPKKYRDYVQEYIYDKKESEPDLTNQNMWYWFYLTVFQNSCVYKKSPSTSQSDIDKLNHTSDNSFGYRILLAQPDGTVKEAYYNGTLQRKDVVTTRPNGIENGAIPGSVDKRCGSNVVKTDNVNEQTIEERINSYAPGAALLLKTGAFTAPDNVLGGGPDGTVTSSCAIDGIGWIVCPVITFAANLADSMFTVLSDSFLKVGVSVVNTDPAKGATTTYTAWRAMQSIANVILVIAFLLMIFSQVSGVGISNRGVKRLLPRLIIVAILINVSFFACQVAVDVSNILGYSLKDFFTGLAATASAGNADAYNQASGNVLGGTNGWANLVGGVLVIAVAGTAGFFMLSMLGTVLLAALLSLLVILLILVARQAIIVMAIVIAPVAIALYLLPNTENLTKQWWAIFSRMLLLFPIVSLLFGASTLAAVVLRDSFGSVVAGQDNVNWLGQIMAAGIQVIPLLATPLVLKGALNAVPLVGNLASKLSGRANANLGKKFGESYKSSVFGRGQAIRRQARDNYRTQKFAARMQQTGKLGAASRIAAQGISALGIGGMMKAQQAGVTNAVNTIIAGQEAEELKNALQALTRELARHKAGGGDGDDFMRDKATTGRTAAERSAAMHLAASTGRDGVVRDLMGSTTGADRDALQSAIDSNAASLGAKAPDLVKGAGKAFESFSGADMAGWSAGTAKAYVEHIGQLQAAGNIAGAQKAIDAFAVAATDIQASADLQAKFASDTGVSLRNAAASVAATSPALAGLPAAFGAVAADGKIR